MARSVDYTIAYESNGSTVDLCKVLFGGDGSYYLTAPYHPIDRAIAALVTVNYVDQEAEFDLREAIDLAVVDDDQQRLKAAHHRDGFIQFSGQGIRSGLDEDGRPKGIGVRSWPLVNPTLGPSFSLAFSDPQACGRASSNKPRTIVLPEAEIDHMRSSDVRGVVVIGYYFPLGWREFVYRQPDGSAWINLVHPVAQATKPLRVALASKECDFPGLIGLEARPHSLLAPGGGPAFAMSTSTGNLRRNDRGELLGDQLLCMYPASDVNEMGLPSLNYPLASTPYQAAPESPAT